MNIIEFKELIDSNTEIVIYGAGLRGEVISRNAGVLGLKVLAFVDKDTDKWGSYINGIQIRPVDYLDSMDDTICLIVSVADGRQLHDEYSKKYKVLPYEMAELLIRMSYVNCEEYGYSSIENIGSYMSPYPDKNSFTVTNPVKDIDYNIKEQELWYNKCLEYYSNLKRKTPYPVIPRYYEQNTKYGIVDALILYMMISELRPKNIIEIGSGFSSAVILDTNEYCFNNKINTVFIEPYPARLKTLLKQKDRIVLHENYLQNINPDIFDLLCPGDILFIDSSHMAKKGSDVNKLYFEILPRLKSGVYIHIHDVFKDFDYPEEWTRNGWVWNEAYILRAFLMNNEKYEIIFFCDMWNDKLSETEMFDNFVGGANLWLRKK